MSRLNVVVGICLLALLQGPVFAGVVDAGFSQGRTVRAPGKVLPLRARVEPVNRMLEERLDEVLPRLMRETGLDMWLVINREYAEDPVYLTLVPEPVFAARRTTMLLFFDRGDEEGVEKLTVSRYPFSSIYDPAWEGGDLEQQWQGLAEVVAARDPKAIGVNVSRHWPVADGLTASLRDRLEEVLGDKYSNRIQSAEELVVRWLETRTAQELEVYPAIVALARSIISEAFSDSVIVPGVTSTEDVRWYIAERFSQLELPIWFIPDVNLQRPSETCGAEDAFCGTSGIIQRGDVLHTDVGICYLRLCTDTQEMGYVLEADESDVPEALTDALAIGNRWQDLLTAEFVTGRSGNEILAAALEKIAAEEIIASVYTHPLGYFGHAPGPTIGMWDNQGDTPVQGDWPLFPSTAYAIEGNVKVAMPDWDGQMVQIKLEQSAVFDGEKVIYLAGRQIQWHVVE
jgi:hypothetical protein